MISLVKLKDKRTKDITIGVYKTKNLEDSA